TVKLDGVVKVNNIALPASQREYVYTADFAELQSFGATGADVEFILTAHQDAQGGTTTTATQSKTMLLPDASWYVRNFEASDSYASSVLLTWDAPSNATAPDSYVLLRDGETLTTLSATAVNYADDNAYPGVSHIYKLVAKYSAEEYGAVTRGGILGDGLITAEMLTKLGLPLVGDSLRIVANVNGIPYEHVAYADDEGKVFLQKLAYDDEGITYTISPAGNVDDYDVASIEHTLSLSAPQGSAGVIYHTLSRDLVGTLANVHCPSGCGRDSVLVTLHADLVTGETVTLDEEKTDFDGQFVFELPYYLTEYQSFSLEVSNRSTNESGESLLPFGYYMGTEESHTVNASDSTLTISVPVSNLNQVDVYPLTISDSIGQALKVKVAGPGDEEVFGQYEFVLRIRETSGKLDMQVTTENREIDLVLPPYELEVSVIDVTKRDAFSLAVLDYFRSRTLTVDHVAEHYEYINAEDRTTYEDEMHYLRYHERAKLVLVGLEAVRDVSCAEPIYVMDSDDRFDNHSVTVQVRPEQIINGQTCKVTGGYVLPKFAGGGSFTSTSADFAKDTLRYVDGEWESTVIVASIPNLVTPFKQLLEFYYYDDYGNYQGATTEEILVEGQARLEGNDVLILIDDPQPVPLYVLRDPPGDKSYAYIEENSSFSIRLENSYKAHFDLGVKREFENQVFANLAGFKLNTGFSVETGETETGLFSLSYQNGLATPKTSDASTNVEGYLDGAEADIIVGADIIMAYGMTEVLNYEACEVDKTRQLTVNPTEINTVWAYTRSQIENTVRYYKDLTDENSGYEITVSGGDQSDADEIIEGIEDSYEAMDYLLKKVDTYFTPACEMCEYVKNLKIEEFFNDGDDAHASMDVVWDYREEVLQFCKQKIGFSGGECTQTMDQMLASWGEGTRDKYRKNYRKYLVLREMERLANDYYLNNANWAGWVDVLDEIDGFDPLENITFSAGASVSRNNTTLQSHTTTQARNGGLNLSFELMQGFTAEFQADSWFGFGGGTKLTGPEIKGKMKYSILGGTTHTWSNAQFVDATESFKSGFVLEDDDEGDHFSIDVFKSATSANGTAQSPYFYTVGGRSSCPYEEGTIARDMPTIQIMNTGMELQPTKYFDLEADTRHPIPVA
ncbi:MAG TPA: hypothetical protein DCP28_35800, partial [Cytophagales bacterium]|nr:hypothetical protein [Cytophagales bacterium]